MTRVYDHKPQGYPMQSPLLSHRVRLTATQTLLWRSRSCPLLQSEPPRGLERRCGDAFGRFPRIRWPAVHTVPLFECDVRAHGLPPGAGEVLGRRGGLHEDPVLQGPTSGSAERGQRPRCASRGPRWRRRVSLPLVADAQQTRCQASAGCALWRGASRVAPARFHIEPQFRGVWRFRMRLVFGVLACVGSGMSVCAHPFRGGDAVGERRAHADHSSPCWAAGTRSSARPPRAWTSGRRSTPLWSSCAPRPSM